MLLRPLVPPAVRRLRRQRMAERFWLTFAVCIAVVAALDFASHLS
jgi:hypothetical protein